MIIKKLFKKKSEIQSTGRKGIFAPISGNLMPLSEVPDPVFSQKLVGDGFAIEPTEGNVFSPVMGKVLSIFPTKHAIAIMSDEGYEILIHFGMDTVNLNGEGFSVQVNEGDVITPETLLLSVNLEAVRLKTPSLITPIIFTNLNEKVLELKRTGAVSHGEENILNII